MRRATSLATALILASAEQFVSYADTATDEYLIDGQGLRHRKNRNAETDVLASQEALDAALAEREAEVKLARPLVLRVASDEFVNLIDHLAPNLLRKRASRIVEKPIVEAELDAGTKSGSLDSEQMDLLLPALEDLENLDALVADNLLEASAGVSALRAETFAGSPVRPNVTGSQITWNDAESRAALEDAYNKRVIRAFVPNSSSAGSRSSFWPFDSPRVFAEVDRTMPASNVVKVTSDGVIEADKAAASEAHLQNYNLPKKLDLDVSAEADLPRGGANMPWALPEAFAKAAITEAGSLEDLENPAASPVDDQEKRIVIEEVKPHYEDSVIEVIPLEDRVNQLVMERPLVFSRDNNDGTGELLLQRPQVRKTVIHDSSDLVMENPRLHTQVELDEGTGLVIAERTYQKPHVRDYRKADEVNALHMEDAKEHETVALLPSGKGFFEKETEKPIAIKIVIPGSNIIETILENPGTYELVRSDVDDPERYYRSRKPFAHERIDGTQSHTFIEQPESIQHERTGLKESWLDKPFVETVKTSDGNTTLWMERPTVREVHTIDITKIEPVSPFTVFNEMFRWGPYMQSTFDFEDEDDFLNIGGPDDLIDREFILGDTESQSESLESDMARNKIDSLIKELSAGFPGEFGNRRSAHEPPAHSDGPLTAEGEETTRAALVARAEELAESSRQRLDRILKKIAELEADKNSQLQEADNEYFDDEFAIPIGRLPPIDEGDLVEENNTVVTSVAAAAAPLVNITIHERGCNGLADFPLYYINLQHQPNRRKYMEETFGTGLTRIGATNGTNYNALVDKFRFANPDDYAKDPWGYLKDKYRTTPGELGVLISHLDALKRAYQDGHETVLILEDDVGTQLCPYWPAPLSVIKKQADLFYPGWHSIQLQWTPVGEQGSRIRSQWFSSIADTRVFADARDKNYGFWNEYTVPLVGRMNTLHGNVATLWSRRGLRHVIQQNLESIVSRTRSGLGIRKWNIPAGYAATADVILKQTPGTYTLFTAPPMFAQRFVDDQSALKNDISWRRHNLYSSIFSLQWYMELQEFYRPGAEGILPLKNFEFKVKE